MANKISCFAHKPYWAYHHHNRATRWSFHLPMENQRGVPEFLHHRMGSYQNRCRVGLGKRAQTSEIGRASCRERGSTRVGEASVESRAAAHKVLQSTAASSDKLSK